MHIESESFIWKVLVISFLSCLSIFILCYCLFNPKNTKNYENSVEFQRITQERCRSTSINPEEEVLDSSKSKKQKQKLKKKQDNSNKKNKASMERLGSRRFSQVMSEINLVESERKRSNSVEDEKSSYLWGLSPKQLSRFFIKKFLNDL